MHPKKILGFSLLVLTLCLQGQSITVFKDEKIILDGNWQLVMNQFLSTQDLAGQQTSTQAEVPGVWNDIIWDSKPIESHGFGTYFRHIVYDGDFPEATLSLEVPEVSLSYRILANDRLLGQVGKAGTSKENSQPKIDHRVYELTVIKGDTIALIFHVSNFHNQAGGLWYAPILEHRDDLVRRVTLNKSLKLILLGCILIGGLFQISIFVWNRRERFSFYFFLVSMTISMLLITRGDMVLLDVFPDTEWYVLKKMLYLAIVLIGPANALFLRDMFPQFYQKEIVRGITIIGIAMAVFMVLAPVQTSYGTIAYLHIYNSILGCYLLFSLVRAALAGKYGAKFLLIGYLAAFATVLYDMLSSYYIIEGSPIQMTPFGIAFYIIQLMFLLAGRYLHALRGKEQLSNHLQKVNEELEIMVDRRTKALSEKNEIIEKQNLKLQKAMQEKDHLMAVVAHDLKAPLSSIMGISEMMGTNLEGQNAEFNGMIQKVTKDGRALIESLTELKVYEEEGFEADQKLFNFSSLFDQKRIAFEAAANKKGIAFSSVFDSKQTMISSDEKILGRIIDNLVSNALKFTPKGEQIHFLVSVQKDKLRIIVKDSGPGFSERDLAKVFQKFQRLSARPTGGESSTGLGLSIVKTLVELLHGEINLDTTQGKGSKFTITIPI